MALARENDTAPPDHPGKYLVRQANCESDRNRWESAERLLIAAHENYVSRLGGDDQGTRKLAQKIARFYRQLDQEDDAQRWDELGK